MSTHDPGDAGADLSRGARDEGPTSQLASGERVIAVFGLDLDDELRFAAGELILTPTRLWHMDQSAAGGGRGRSWPLDPGFELRVGDRSGLGLIEWVGPEGRVASWRFTSGRMSAARDFLERYTATRRGETTSEADGASKPRACPVCGAGLGPDQTECHRCADRAAKPGFSALLRLTRFAGKRRAMIALGMLLTLASTAAGLVPPYLTQPLLDDVLIPRRHFELFPWYMAALAGAAVLAWLLSWARTYVVAWFSERIAADLRNQTYEHLQRLSLEYFGGKRTGDLMSRIGSDTDRINNFLSINLLDFSTDLVMITLTSAMLFWLDPWLALATLAPFPIIAWLVGMVRGRLKRGFQRGNRAWSEMTSVLADTIPGIRVVKAFAQERREVERFRESNDRVLTANDRINTTWAFFGPMISLLTQLGLLSVWGFGAWRVYQGDITPGILMAFQVYISRFYVRLESMSRMVQATQRAAASTHRIFEILDRVPSIPEPTRPVHLGRVRGEIEFRNVAFRHGARPILEDISLSVQPGEMIGLVGPSGAGKSTLVNLVCRFYDVGEGAILVDGVDIRSFPVSEYRRNIGIVLQEPFLFYGTIAENIAYGMPGAAHEAIVAAARAARAHEFILRLPDGYDSIVGERGQSLSGGERQRISIARALLIDPRILILDEATSSVDTETEREIQVALDNLIEGRTTIAIAHRLSTLRRADRLVVLEHGRVVESGPHQDLLENPSGMFSRLHRAQVELALGVAE